MNRGIVVKPAIILIAGVLFVGLLLIVLVLTTEGFPLLEEGREKLVGLLSEHSI